ncbi:MAG: hypothetical protein RMI30_00830 [Thermodesulfovibrio sp.]|nr:hypothetical protein [Thermodesulfovibrio sp.]
MEAWELYDGVIFRMLKKIEREEGFPENLSIIILSAKYGFIKPSDYISYYDHRLDSKTYMKPFLLNSLKKQVECYHISKIFICLGKDYLSAIEGFETIFSKKTQFLYATGGIGLKMSQLKKWIQTLKEE